MAEDAAADTRAPVGHEPEAIFVVGVSRSGTTLMRRILESHSRIAIATENHYLGHLLPREGARYRFLAQGDLHDDATIRRIVDLVYSPVFQEGTWLRESSPYWRWVGKSVPREELERRLLAAERTERGLFTALLRVYADDRGRPIMGEKTPAHVKWADLLLEWYPTARIIHMMRDPRGVFVSEVRRRNERAVSVPYRWLVRVPVLMRWFILLEVAWAWSGAVHDHRRLLRAHPASYRRIRFEDLVADPEREIAAVCAFLGVEPEAAMLTQRVVSKGSNRGQRGFDAGAADRWRSSIGRWEERVLLALVGRRLDEMGFERDPQPPGS